MSSWTDTTQHGRYAGRGEVCSIHALADTITNVISCRYINMDLSFLLALRNAQISRIGISYDIACQWTRNLHKCMPLFPPELYEPYRLKEITSGIPKFHLPGHGDKCSTKWSLNFCRGWARTDGEGVERNWACVERFATAMREMAAGSRHDFLDFQIGAANRRKICGLGR